MKRLALLIAIILGVQLVFPSPVQSAPEDSIRVKELNFVFLHGAGSHACSAQLLNDSIREQISGYISDYEQAHPGTEVRVNTLIRCYPNDVDIDTWANNIADDIDKHFHGKENLILVGHSMGGKVALYAVAQNIGGLAGRVAAVVTINSPIKRLDKYLVVGGGSVLDYCRARWLLVDGDVCRSIAYYDSSEDGRWVAYNRYWLAFISSEATPLSKQFDVGGVDGWPRNMDDGIIPISAQYSDGADVIYYGEHGHGDFALQDGVAEFMADQILRYIFGGRIECSVFARSGDFEHEADWLLGTDYWDDVVGEVLASGGRLQHKNESYIKWQEWEDVVGECLPEGKRSSGRVSQVSFPFLTSIMQARWFSPEDPEDCRLYIKTRAAPRTSVQADWMISQRGLLPGEVTRDHYEVEIVAGTPLTGIRRVSWRIDNPLDLRLRIYSEAQSPFRWFKAKWRVYYKESRQRKVIDEIPGETVSGTNSGS
ncbi:MAG: alpha/beta fold hydrolase [Dehalococcoidales bacterium]